MARTYPMAPPTMTQSTGRSPSATTDESQKYKNMLGFQAAGEDVGLFYQMNQAAIGNQDMSAVDERSSFQPVEAGGQYA